MDKTNEYDSLLELHLHGDLPELLRKRAEAILATPEGQARLEALRRSDASVLQDLPPRTMADKIRRRVSETSAMDEISVVRTPAMRWAFGSALAISLGMVALVAVPRGPSGPSETVRAASRSTARENAPASGADIGTLSNEGPTDPISKSPDAKRQPEVAPVVALAEVPDDGLRTKGAIARMRVHRVEVGSTETVSLRDGDQAVPGTTLQVALLAGPRSQIAVMSVDGAGQVSRHIPEAGDSSMAVEAAMQAAHSFQIDDAPGFERFVLVQSDRPFALQELESFLARARGQEPLPVRKGWSFQTLRILKPEARR